MGIPINKGYRIRSIRQADNCRLMQMLDWGFAQLRKHALGQIHTTANTHLRKLSLG